MSPTALLSHWLDFRPKRHAPLQDERLYPEGSAAPATTAAKDRRPIIESQPEFGHRRLLRHRLEIGIDLHLDSTRGLTTFNQLFYIPGFRWAAAAGRTSGQEKRKKGEPYELPPISAKDPVS